MISVEAIIEQLGLEPLQCEGGYFRQTWRSTRQLTDPDPGSKGQPRTRPAGTAIYFLVTTDQFSALHRLAEDEIWFHHFGDPLEMLMLHPDGRGETVTIGPDLTADQRPQHCCPAQVWQGTRIVPGQARLGYALGSCAMAPGFDWNDFELGDREALARRYPEFARVIRNLTRV